MIEMRNIWRDYRQVTTSPEIIGAVAATTEMALCEAELAGAMLALARSERQPAALASLIEELQADGLTDGQIGKRLNLSKYNVRKLVRGDNRYGDFVHGWL